MPPTWHATLPHGGNNLQMINWWSQFNDPTLIYFIESAISTNPSLAQSVAKIKQAQANVSAANSFFFPSITGNASGYVVNNSIPGAGGSSITSSGGATNPSTNDFIANTTNASTAYSAGANATWELDLFGAIARNTQLYQARLDASVANWNDARVSLVAQVADTYVSARACQSLLDIYQKQFNSRTATQGLTQKKVNVGFAPVADRRQGAGLVAQSLSDIEKQKSSCEQYNNTLVALTGITHNIIESKMAESYADIPLPKDTTIGAVPAEILSQRPDVSSAERSVAAAVASIDVAIANRYPSVSLTGSITANSGTLYAGQPNSWSFGPAISLPITDGGYLKAQVALARGQYDEAAATYKLKVLTAVKETENALVRINQAHKQVAAANAAVTNYQVYFDAMNKKYQIGWSNLLDLETVRINLVNYQGNLTNAKLEEVQAWVALYKAVGGEWKKQNLTDMAESK